MDTYIELEHKTDTRTHIWVHSGSTATSYHLGKLFDDGYFKGAYDSEFTFFKHDGRDKRTSPKMLKENHEKGVQEAMAKHKDLIGNGVVVNVQIQLVNEKHLTQKNNRLK